MKYKRTLNLKDAGASEFLFGPRMTGKTTLLADIKYDLFIDLLDPVTELEYQGNLKIALEQFAALQPRSTIVIDEVQKIPELLNYVQLSIEKHKHKFILSGSSARKLKRGGANLLGGRALDLKLHPLTYKEIEKDFNLELALSYGTLPKIYSLLMENEKDLAKNLLRSYHTTYIKEEIQLEALTRNVPAFQRFLKIAGQMHGQTIEYSSIAQSSSVPASTVKEYFSILEDTLIGRLIFPYNKSERKKSRGKFYLFDPGVARALQDRLNDPPTGIELGFLFEGWFINEIQRLSDYYNKDHTLTFFKEDTTEIDLLVSKGSKTEIAFEIKSNKAEITPAAVVTFKKRFPNTPLYIVSLKDKVQRKLDHITILPWREALEIYLKL